MNYYPNLKALRTANNFKQEYVADILGISQPEYSKLESGQRRLDTDFIKTLCKLYDVNIDYLLNQPQIIAAPSHVPMIPANSQPISPDVLTKLLENYSNLVESLVKQQQVHEKILDKILSEYPFFQK